MPAVYVFPLLSTAQACVAAVDAVQGPYPQAGIDFGPGIHAPAVKSQTKTYGPIYRNNLGTLWAYISDATSIAVLPSAIGGLLPVSSSIDLSATGNWAGAVQVWP